MCFIMRFGLGLCRSHRTKFAFHSFVTIHGEGSSVEGLFQACQCMCNQAYTCKVHVADTGPLRSPRRRQAQKLQISMLTSFLSVWREPQCTNPYWHLSGVTASIHIAVSDHDSAWSCGHALAHECGLDSTWWPIENLTKGPGTPHQ